MTDSAVKHSNAVSRGHSRAKALTPERRSEIAQKAAATRWSGSGDAERRRLRIKVALASVSDLTVDEALGLAWMILDRHKTDRTKICEEAARREMNGDGQ